jgi:hypothetical protein
MEVLLGFVFGSFKGILPLFMPLGGLAVKPLGKYVAAALSSITDIAQFATQQITCQADTLPQHAATGTFFVGLALNKAGLIAIVTIVAVKSKLKPCVSAIIVIVSGKGLEHLFHPFKYLFFSCFNLLATGSAVVIKEKLHFSAPRVVTTHQNRFTARLAFVASNKGGQATERTGYS